MDHLRGDLVSLLMEVLLPIAAVWIGALIGWWVRGQYPYVRDRLLDRYTEPYHLNHLTIYCPKCRRIYTRQALMLGPIRCICGTVIEKLNSPWAPLNLEAPRRAEDNGGDDLSEAGE